ncbi:MAG: YebC/PmpR family DNA-binding transcriptional regulator, partial [Cyanobacteria bacterium P01_G01_bin.19]
MAGHSKWANIKRQKARVDAKRGKTFTQLSRAIIVAARNGIADPDGNFQLRTAIEKAKAAGVSNESIERSLAKGAGTYQDDDAILEEIRYEGYGAGGVAILIEALTDNRNRTAAYLRSAFTKNGGNLGETGCVSWMFDRQGVVTLDPVDEEKLLEASMEGEADTYE